MRMMRQGDVLIMAVTALPDGELVEVPREEGLVVLAHGEQTGHKHAFSAMTVSLLRAGSSELYLRVEQPSPLEHEEHDPIVVPQGVYRVIRQREYTPEAVRLVAD
jgi:hypothetical protein